MSSYSPKRAEGESFEAYKSRRQASNESVRAMQRNPNHGLIGARQKYRDEMRRSGAMGKRIRAADALIAAWASKRVTKWQGPRDEHGVVCLIGKPYELVGIHPTSRELVLEGWVDGKDYGYTVQRKWLGGISAQRGY